MSALQERDSNAVARPVTHVPPPVIDWSRVTASSSNENAIQQPKKAAPAPSSKKRKSDTQDVDIKAIMFPDDAVYPSDLDPRLLPTDQDTCGRIRQKIRKWIESGAMKVGEFRDELGVSGPAYGRFMSRTGTWDGEYTDTYIEAVRFFKKRELAGLPLSLPKSKRPKTIAEKKQEQAGPNKSTDTHTLLETDDWMLPGEDDCSVLIYMTCNEVRKELRALLKKGISQAALCRALSKQYPEESGRSVSAANLRYFMGQNGVDAGNASTAFYAGYCLLEKLRLKSGKAKSDFREDMEDIYGGMGFRTDSNKWFIGPAGKTPMVDEYGRVRFM
ncbi:hypothetical protein NLU13_5828 [Sarocladium strictum]|uniref:DUF7726 domain-containing protein n=1 Tax=Sarocladium strictum TaxID=5046 RepID=A0AA39GFD6_SARSR|nr:hypothetical protein NLU13_5828 [Sarocladium strictum]